MFRELPVDARALVFLALIPVGGVLALAWKFTADLVELFAIAAVVLIIVALLLFVMTIQFKKFALTMQDAEERHSTALRQEEQQRWALSRDLSLAIADGIEGSLTNWSLEQEADAWAGLILSIEASGDAMAASERDIRDDMAKRIKDRVGVLAYKYRRVEAQALLDQISKTVEYRKALKYD